MLKSILYINPSKMKRQTMLESQTTWRTVVRSSYGAEALLLSRSWRNCLEAMRAP